MSLIIYFSPCNLSSSIFSETLKENFEKLLRSKSSSYFISELSGYEIHQIVIGPAHIGILTKCGKICRIPFTYKNDETLKPPPEKSKNVIIQDHTIERVRTSNTAPFQLYNFYSLESDRNIRNPRVRPSYIETIFSPETNYEISRRSRNTNIAEVPDTLIEQVQSILQGRNRDIIIRELQRSNLNVNAAVNALLNQEDTSSGNWDNISLNQPVFMVSEDMLQTSSRNRRNVKSEDELINKSEATNLCEIEKSQIEWWNADCFFTHIGAMFTDLIAVDLNGNLRQWLWISPSPIQNEEGTICGGHQHLRAGYLKLANEIVTDMSCSFCRATVVLKTNKVAYWMDSALFGVNQLEGTFYIGQDLKNVMIRKVHCNNLYTVVLLANGSLWWWGVLPYSQRNKIVSTKNSKKSRVEINIKSNIRVGSYVTTRSSGALQMGVLAYYFDNFIVKMGKLAENITSNKTSAKFIEVWSDITQSDTEIVKKSKKTHKCKILKSRKRKHNVQTQLEGKEEEWPLSNVVFLNKKSNNIGVVVKIDKDNVLVEFGPTNEDTISPKTNKDVGEVCSLKNSRIYNIKDLKVFKRPHKKSIFLPHCQAHPRRIDYPKNSVAVGFTTNAQGIHVLSHLKNEHVVLDYFVPNSKIIQTFKLPEPISNLLNTSSELIHFKIHDNCLALQISVDDICILFKNHSGNYSFAPFPSLPSIKVLESSDLSSDNKIALVVSVVCNVGRLSDESAHLDYLSVDQIFHMGQNIIHFFSYLVYVSEVSFEGNYFDAIMTKFKDLITATNDDILKNLLCQTDFEGFTPFIYSVKIRSYKFAVELYKIIKKFNHTSFLNCALFSNLPYYYNPIYLLCTNEVCSFTWTGSSHTDQDIFECRTCGISDELCVCAECAFTCHRGHDCVRKHTNPSAFCDCWERCLCQSMYAGDQSYRKELFRLLINENSLLTNIGSGCEHIMLYIIKTMSRQNKEYKSFRTGDPPSLVSRTEAVTIKQQERSNILGVKIQQMRQPIKFMSFALKLLLTVKETAASFFTSAVSDNSNEHLDTLNKLPYYTSTYHLIPGQVTGKIYDCFLFNLFTRCDKSFTRALYTTLKENFSESSTYNPNTRSPEVLINFIRACARIYIVITSAMSPFLLNDCAKRNSINNDQYRVLYRIIFFFKRFPITSIIELSQMSFSIISPVIYGGISHRSGTLNLYIRMNEVNDFVSTFFSTIPSSTPNKNSKKPSLNTTAREALTRDYHLVRDLVRREYLQSEHETFYTNEGELDSDGSDYSVYSDHTGYEDEEEDEAEENTLYDETHIDDASHIHDFPTLTEAINRSVHSSETEIADNDLENTISDPENIQSQESSPFAIIHSNEFRTRSSFRMGSLNPNYQWAVRTYTSVDPRSDTSTTIRAPTSDASNPESLTLSMSIHSGLSRSFMLVVKLIADLCYSKKIFEQPGINNLFASTIGHIFLWMFDVCESAESKLRFGMLSLNSITPYLQPGRWDYEIAFGASTSPDPTPGNNRVRRRNDNSASISNVQKNRNDFVGNLLSLLRSSNNEHFGILPYLDLNSHKHLAYILDGFLYFISARKSFTINDNFQNTLSHSSLVYRTDVSNNVAKSFFIRTSSTLSFSNTADILTPIIESFPLAVFPSILNISSTKKDLFNSKELPIQGDPILNLNFNFISSNFYTAENRVDIIKQLLNASPDTFFARWHSLIDIFGQIFFDSVGCEGSSIYREICRFESKQNAFRIFLDKLKSATTSELKLENLDRRHDKIIVQTFKILNNQFQKRELTIRAINSPFSRIRVLFKDEPGEGSGVTRNFFSVICDAIKSIEKLPDLTSTFDLNETIHVLGPNTESHIDNQSMDTLLGRLGRSIRSNAGRGEPNWAGILDTLDGTITEPHSRQRRNATIINDPITLAQIEQMTRDPSLEATKQTQTRLTVLLKKKVTKLSPDFVTLGVEALMQLSPDVLYNCISDDEYLKSRLHLIIELYGDLKHKSSKSKDMFEFFLDASVFPEDSPLFFQPGKPGFYFPTNAKKTFSRLNAYRNVGRIIGLALLFHEIIPFILTRPVLKFLLGRPVSFHDFAFYDPVQFESLRMLMLEGEKIRQDNPKIEMPIHGLNFCLNVVDSNDCPHTVDLVPGGSNVVTFSDEASGLNAEKSERFKNWFWEVIESFDALQKSELLLFWTSSPLLNDSDNLPKPNITIKNCSTHLPTSNTCVMRLYIPAYEKKSVLKSKLLLAIKTKTFGFI
ncbi:hypothetical protein HZS_6382 [Henneguya salminicola]|nr:hypothetical protein HZS_6382 [Henneguya salminicola]